jgi:hypothetical protein
MKLLADMFFIALGFVIEAIESFIGGQPESEDE